jgi:hypothetical protein
MKKVLMLSCVFAFLLIFSYNAVCQTNMIAEITDEVNTSFGTYHPYAAVFTPNVPSFTVEPDFSNVYRMTSLSPTDSLLLLKNHFTVRKSECTQIYEVYNQSTDDGKPVFVTTDAMLHAYHVLFDRFLRKIEEKLFFEKLNLLTESLLNRSDSLYNNAQKTDTREALFNNLAYFSVAKKLLNGDYVSVPDTVLTIVTAELELIAQHAGYNYSPILGDFSKLDYSQFQVRGHYTRSDTLRAFFKAMMWYGWTRFTMEPDLFEDLARRHTLQTLSMIQLLFSEQVNGQPLSSLWQSLYEPTIFFVGKTDDPNIYDYKNIADQIYGDNFLNLSVDSLANESLLNAFMDQAQLLPEPGIPNWIYGTFITYKGFRFMGQRFIPDSYMFSELVMPKVGDRIFPKGLDVITILGSDRAFTILDSVYNETNYPNYSGQIDTLKQEFINKSPEEWAQNLYWNWLYCLMPLLYQKGTCYPHFMQTFAWVDKELMTALASWAELRHDTILYAKQSETPRGGGADLPKSYVEPNPYLYARLASLVRYTREGLQNFNLLLPAFQEPIQLLEDYLIFLRDVSIKELENTPLSDSDHQNIFSFGKILEDICTDPDDPQNSKDNMAIIADVHTDSNTNQCLEEGVGYPLEILVIVNEDGLIRLTRGAVFSYYEFPQPISNRLTDEAWRDMLINNSTDMPEWMSSFLDLDASQPPYLPDTPQNFYGNQFSYVTSISNQKNVHLPDTYSLTQNFPNPFNPETIIQYELPQNNHVTIIIYNILGQKIATLYEGEKLAGRHTIKWDGKNSSGHPVPSGLYLYKIITDSFVSVKKMSLIR